MNTACSGVHVTQKLQWKGDIEHKNTKTETFSPEWWLRTCTILQLWYFPCPCWTYIMMLIFSRWCQRRGCKLQLNYKYHTKTDQERLEALCILGLLWKPGFQSSALPEDGGRGMGCWKQSARKRKCHKCARVCASLRTHSSRLVLPSILLSNVCSLNNKLD